MQQHFAIRDIKTVGPSIQCRIPIWDPLLAQGVPPGAQLTVQLSKHIHNEITMRQK